MDALDSKGLPTIVSDGDPSMAPGMTAHMLMSILNSGHYRSINTLIYASFNLSAAIRQPFGRGVFLGGVAGQGTGAGRGVVLGAARGFVDGAHVRCHRSLMFEIDTPADGIERLQSV